MEGLPRQLKLVTKKSSSRTPKHAKKNRLLNAAGLFAGIGGLELGLARAGHTTSLLCEIDPGANAVLDSRFPGIDRWNDICSLDDLPSNVDIVTAGFPCQDLSQAGQTLGIEGSRSGLIGEVFRLIRRRNVPWVLLENVPFMLQLGRGRALEVIVASIEELGYKWAYRIVNSRAFGLPQRRERVYMLASLEGDPRDILLVDDADKPADDATMNDVPCGFYWTEGVRGLGWAVDSVPTLKGGSTIGIPSPPAIVFPDGRVGKPDIRDAERLQGFDVDWTAPAVGVTKKGHRWKLVGNAVTVDSAEWIGRRLREPGKYDQSGDQLLAGQRWPNAAWNVGDGRHAADIGKFPTYERASLAEFLEFPIEPLSPKATAGFLSRAARSNLRFPRGFIEQLENHLARVEEKVVATG